LASFPLAPVEGAPDMQRVLRGLIALSSLLLVLPSLGCQFAEFVTIEIPDYDSSSVEGIWIWRDLDGDYERAAEIKILDHQQEEAGEYVVYSVRDPDGRELLALPATIVRNELNPSSVQISFFVHVGAGGGTLRASTYNAAGESTLSSQVLDVSSS
jgi:hypothetical protein